MKLLILVLAVSRMLSFLSCMKGGLEKGFGLKRLFPSIGGLGDQFLCQLDPCALMLISGSFADSLNICFGLWLGCLVDWGGFFLAGLVLTMAA